MGCSERSEVSGLPQDCDRLSDVQHTGSTRESTRSIQVDRGCTAHQICATGAHGDLVDSPELYMNRNRMLHSQDAKKICRPAGQLRDL